MSKQFCGWFLFVAIVSMVFFVSCTTTRKTIKAPLKERGAAYLVRKMREAELNFETFSTKAKVSATIGKGNSTNFNAVIRIQKDSLIWFSISFAIGIEVARVKITPDSVFFLNHFQKNYFVGESSMLSKLFQTNLDYDILQSLLIGNDLSDYEDNGFKASIEKLEYKLMAANRQKVKKEIKKSTDQSVYIQHIWLNPDNFKISQINIKEYAENDNRTLAVSYDNFESVVGTQQMPSSLQINLNFDQNVQLKLSYSNIKINEKLSFPFNIPNKYSKIL
ncbi:MAG: DUF4292 domain-containing protein [Lentimicrobiaceae bacterium]|jgi:hypothetical protein|nr:DUF4292 domain-containing protein [Lentimicrobiaceae bacterium]